MNAGRGRAYGKSISDYLETVKVWNGNKIIKLSKEKCCFGYRESIFQKEKRWIILAAEFCLPKQIKQLGYEKMRERIEFVRETQDLKYPNVGTIFKDVSKRAARELMGKRIEKAAFSNKTSNWLINLGGAKSKDFVRLINLMRVRSLLYGVIPKLEIELWR